MTSLPANSRWPQRAALALAVAAVVAAAMLAMRSPDPGLAALGTENIPVKVSLDSCTEPGHDGSRSCRIAVEFDPVAEAEEYDAAITAPDGTHLLTAAAEPRVNSEPSVNSYEVPYVGNGIYVVRITAYAPASGLD